MDDNIASKMVALVSRGAPRDFVDVKRVVDAGLVSVARCLREWYRDVFTASDTDDARAHDAEESDP